MPNYGYNNYGEFYLDRVRVKGPLALLALVMFRKDSFIDMGACNLSVINDITSVLDVVCYQYAPLSFIMGPQYCSTSSSFAMNGMKWVQYFTNPNYAFPVLNQAAILANQVIFSQGPDQNFTPFLSIYNRNGLDVSTQSLSTAARIGLSMLISVFLFSLMTLCGIATTQVAWVGSLNSYVMLKILLRCVLASTPLLVRRKSFSTPFLDTLGTQSRLHRLVDLLLEPRYHYDGEGHTGEDKD